MARILLIEDNDAIRSLLRDTLEHAGHTLIEARNGAEGLDLFRQAGADLVLTDMVMPGTDGLDVVRGLRDMASLVKIIAISGAGERGEDYLALAHDMGGVRVLLKPFTADVLMTAIDELLPGDR
jgi:two-component system, NtrC family, response regulator AtoC